MEFKLLYWKHFLTVQCLCVCLQLDDATIKFMKKNHQSTLECFTEKQEIEVWQVGVDKISAPKWVFLKNSDIQASVNSDKTNILNFTVTSSHDIRIDCQSTEKSHKFLIIPLSNEKGNIYPSSETPNAIKDKKFTLRCKTDDTGVIWFTGNGLVIAKYIGLFNQNYSRYFGSRQETHCQSKICTLSITSIRLDDDNMSIVCKTNFHTSLFNIRVFVLPKSVTVKAISDTVPVENQNKSYECLIKDTNPEFSVFWLITWKNGTQINVTKYISNKPSKSGELITLSSKLTLTLNKNFKELQCVAYFPGKSEFVYCSMKLDMPIKYSLERDDMTLNVSGGKVCVDTPTKFHCSWKGGDPPVSVTLMYKNISNTSKEEVEVTVTPSESHRTVKCLGTHIAANVSHEKNFTIYYPPKTIEIKTDEPFLEGRKGILHCKAINGYPEKYSYRWDPNNNASQNLTLSRLSRTQNNKVFICYASNMCNKERELRKVHWINVEYVPDIIASENMTLIENQASIVNCSAKGNPIPEVRLEYENQSFPSNSPLTFNRRNSSDVFCVANAKSTKHGNLTSRKKINIMLKYPPQVNIHISNETNNTLLINCTAFDGNPEKYEYKLKQKWGNITKNTYNINVLSINNSTFNNTGTWECHVSNEDFHVSKSSNYKIPVKPIFSSISNDAKKKNVSIGESVIFKQCFYSHPKSDVKWQINDKLIDFNKYLTTDFVSSDFPFKGSCTHLKTEDIKDNDIRTYTLTLENSVGKEVITFTLRHKEITEVTLGTIIGCFVGIVLLITLVLLIYNSHKIRAVKCKKDISSAKGVVDYYETIPDKRYNAVSADATNLSKLKTEREQDAEDSEPRYLSVKHPDTDDIYVNVLRKPDGEREQDSEDSEPRYLPMKHPDMNDVYVSVSRKPDAMREQDSEDSEPRYLPMKHPDMNDVYVSVSRKPDAEREQDAEDSEPRYLPMKHPDVDDVYVSVSRKPDAEREQDAEDNEPKYLPMKHPDMDDVFVSVSRKPDDKDSVYVNVSRNSGEEQHAEVNEPEYLCMEELDMDDAYGNISRKPDTVEEQCTEISDPRYLCMKQPHMDGAYVNDSQIPGKMDDAYGNISRRPDTVEEQCTEISDPRYLCMKQPDMDGAYVNDSQIPGKMDDAYGNISRRPDNMDGAYINYSQKPGTVEDQYAEMSHPRYLCMKKLAVEVQYGEVSEHIYIEMKKRDMDVDYVNVPKNPGDYQ
ncbi:uncharacterized protein LOC115212116 [Octopus sinensis]|uniref:Uncharacterized protein LOC115212116 n=1 Tax=Octopus sinensis TaxID=2607531 RepID=A0A7E6EWU6_9MOLL|nr:uncharacterized protein LOC115212116 [Octopus sinensis]